MGLAWNICAPLGTLSTFFSTQFQVSTAKNEINLFNNHILIVAPVTFAPAGAMTPSAEFLFYKTYLLSRQNGCSCWPSASLKHSRISPGSPVLILIRLHTYTCTVLDDLLMQ